MRRSLFSVTAMAVALVSLTGCGLSQVGAPIAYAPISTAGALAARQATSAGDFTLVTALDPADRRAKAALDKFFATNPVVVRMQPRSEDHKVLNAWLGRLAARQVAGGATEFVAESQLNGGMIPHSFESHRASRTLRFTVTAGGRLTAFEHLAPEAFGGFTIAPPPFKPLQGETPEAVQAAFTRDLKADRRLGAFVNLYFQLALTGEKPDGHPAFAKVVALTFPEGTLFRVTGTWTEAGQTKSQLVDLLRSPAGTFTAATNVES